MSKKKVYIAVSGGVDSAAATGLLLDSGYDCVGMYMITHDLGVHGQTEAQQVCEHFNIPLKVLDMRAHFQQIIDYFCSEYQKARTPNPCVYCNRVMKFGRLWQYAREQGADFIATGHYARLLRIHDEPGVYMAADPTKDQSYVLSLIDRAVLGHILLPLGDMTDKEQTRKRVADYGLNFEDTQESQEICFIPDDDYIAMLGRWCPHIGQPGNIVDTDGHILGQHQGIHRYTIGQRRGLGIALGEPAYVVKLDAETNEVTLGTKDHVLCSKLRATDVNWLIETPQEVFDATIKIRYNHRGAAGRVIRQPDNLKTVIIEFDQPVSAITPGQAAVMYVETEYGKRVVGGGWISEAVSDEQAV